MRCTIRKKGDGKGSLKPRKLKGLLDGEEHTFTVRPYVKAIQKSKLPEIIKKGAKKRD